MRPLEMVRGGEAVMEADTGVLRREERNPAEVMAPLVLPLASIGEDENTLQPGYNGLQVQLVPG